MSDPRIGTRIGGYEIESLLGRGGMGVVYLASHLHLGRKVALKVLAPELAEDESFRTRFVRESQIAASIDHPNVIPVYDAAEVDGSLYLAMRYVEGTDLKKVIERDGAIDPGSVAEIITQVGGALDAAHAKGLIHRDVKPANVLVGTTETGPNHVYLTDFGLTKHSSSKSGLTATGAFVGTIDYIAPEQIEGKPIDAKTDIYALGCVLYECLTGEIPFKKDADVAVMYAHLMDPRPIVTQRNPALPAAVDAVVQRAMARDPGERHESGAALAADLRNALGVEAPVAVSGVAATPTPPTPPPITKEEPVTPVTKEEPAPAPERSRSKLMIPAGIAALVLVAGLAFFLTRGGGEKPTGPQTTVPANAIYVGPDGKAGASGDKNDPVADLAEAVKLAQEGGTVIVADGSYTAADKPMLKIDEGVTISAAEGATPVLEGSAEFPTAIEVVAGTSDVTISGLTFEGFPGEGVKVFCNRCNKDPENGDITLRDLEFTEGGSPLIIENVNGLTLDRINVHDNEFTGFVCSPGPCNQVSIVDSFFHSSAHRFGEGVRIESGDDVVIETSDMAGNPGNGLYSNASATVVTRSRFQDNRGAGAILSGSGSEIRDSITAQNGQEGVILGQTFDCESCRIRGTFTVANVLVADNNFGVSVDAEDSDDFTLQMFNSIVTGNDGTGLRIRGPVELTRLDHDLFNTGEWISVVYKGETYYGDDLNNSDIPVPNNSESYGAIPEFLAPDDYHLAPDSPGVNEGTDEGVDSQVDIDGNPRVAGEAIDIGPYER